MSFGKDSRSSRASTYSSNSGYRVDPDSIRENCQERATWNSAGIRMAGSPEILRRPCQGRLMVDSWVARWNFGGKPVYLERRCKGTANICPFPNFLARKCKKSAFWGILGAKMMIYWNEYAGVLSMAQREWRLRVLWARWWRGRREYTKYTEYTHPCERVRWRLQVGNEFII